MSYATAAVKITAANTNRDGTGANVELLLEATRPCYVERVVFQPLGTIVATAARIFVNNGQAINDGTNNTLNREATIPAATASETAAVPATDLVLDLYLAAGQRLLVTVGTAPAAGVDATAVVAPNYRDFNV